MRIKIVHPIIIVDILTVILVLAITFTPSGALRIVFGLPFVLFFPGYAFLSAFFTPKKAIGNLESVALCVIISIAMVGLIGFGFNMTPDGIRLEGVLYSITAVILVTSMVTIIRNYRSDRGSLTRVLYFSRPDRRAIIFRDRICILFAIAILAALGFLGHLIIMPHTAESFTEFYILGPEGKAQNYPADFILEDGRVVSVRYGADNNQVNNRWGEFVLGIVNQEQQPVIYRVRLTINNQSASIYYQGNFIDQIEQIRLSPGQKWEQEVGFAPQHTGNHQKVEIWLYHNNEDTARDSLYFWINVR